MDILTAHRHTLLITQIANNNVRDQLATVQSLSSLAGILHVKVGAAAYACFCTLAAEWTSLGPVDPVNPCGPTGNDASSEATLSPRLWPSTKALMTRCS